MRQASCALLLAALCASARAECDDASKAAGACKVEDLEQPHERTLKPGAEYTFGSKWFRDFEQAKIALDLSGGYAYLLEPSRYRVQAFTAEDGKYIQSFGKKGKNGGGNLAGPSAVAPGEEGSIFVADKCALYKFEPATGAMTMAAGSCEELSEPTLLAGDRFEKWMYAYDAATQKLRKFDTEEGSPLAFDSPALPGASALAVGADGGVYVAFADRSEIIKLDPLGKQIRQWGGKGSGDGQFELISDLACDAENNVFVLDASQGRVQVFTEQGEYLTSLGSKGNADGQLKRPTSMDVTHSADSIFIIDDGKPPQDMTFVKGGAEGPAGLARVPWSTIISLCCLIAILGLYPSVHSSGGGMTLGRRTSVNGKLQSRDVSVPVAAAAGAAAKPAAAAAAGLPAAAGPTAAAAAAAGADPSSRETTRWFKPTGYDLPAECWKHEDMYAMVFDNLRPWMARGITKADLDACAPAATPETDTKFGTPGGMQFRLLLWENEVIITSGGIRRQTDGHGHEGLEYYQISQIQDAARRFGLPTMEFAVGFGDLGHIRGSMDGPLCPLMIYCKQPSNYDILIPDGQFTQYLYDKWLDKNRKDGYGEPWEEKTDKAIGRYLTYCSYVPQTDRHGRAEPCMRNAYVNHSRDSTSGLTELDGPGMSLTEQRRWKYSLHLDGLGCSNRLQKIMATGQTVIRQDSNLTEFFYAALRPWVHYVPTGYNGVEEVDRIVQFLRDNDDLARAIGEQARRFAHEHLNEEGRLCYIKVLFEEMKKLMKYEVTADDFPVKISYDEEVKQYVPMEKSHMIIANTT
ncbi:NHL repeat containing [Micractinium conductrix]|uniref:NHL repeat containing n=1 Tax=Micractinium conductrix TaxID=554055 RepID=A0A2P6VRF0_9CHLO|nr:NHL repeat containing [Micractinium conductrix]|eukprot:PSC76645.1 NHL repeat containing [Micractinium conductrix]